MRECALVARLTIGLRRGSLWRSSGEGERGSRGGVGEGVAALCVGFFWV